MVEQDTINLLRECDAGIKMGVASIDEVRDYAKSAQLRGALTDCKRQHEQLKDELQQALDRFGDDGKNPNPMAKGMSWLKTNVKLGVDLSDATIADLMTDGCNMGVKSLTKYLNEYEAADENAKDLTKKLIAQEQQLADQMRQYL
ncbi:MAG: hypothetical protein CW335_06120 [Clostridiales bacterium]|nr:hypothetical protein [Clostridiales bacterium]